MAKNYYLVLGVPTDAAPRAIRSAFRRLARLHHPDHQGSSGVPAFREATEAYEVLSDPVRRARYDRELLRSVRRQAEPPLGLATEPEPLVSDSVPITGRPEAVRPSFEALFDRLTRNFTGVGRPKGEREEPLRFELVLAPEEAGRGIVIPFQVPVLTVCSRCRGGGRVGLFACAACDGSGRLTDARTLEVHVPAGVRDGAVIEVPLSRLGVENLWLIVHVRVARH